MADAVSVKSTGKTDIALTTNITVIRTGLSFLNVSPFISTIFTLSNRI